MILNKNKVEEAGKKFLLETQFEITTKLSCFKAGASYIESELSELAIEFAEWVVGEGWIQAETYNTFKNVYHANINEDVRLTTNELFEIFTIEIYDKISNDKKQKNNL